MAIMVMCLSASPVFAEVRALYCGPQRTILEYVHEGQFLEQGMENVKHSSGYRDYCLHERLTNPDGTTRLRDTTPAEREIKVATLPEKPGGMEVVILPDGTPTLQTIVDRTGTTERRNVAKAKLKALNLTDDDLAALGIR